MSTHTISANFNYPTTYRLGSGRLKELPSACVELHMAQPLMVTDQGVRNLAWFEGACAALAAAGLRYNVFSEVASNPSDIDVQKGVQAYLEGHHDGIVLIGGGAAMDVGKCIAVMAHHSGSVFDYEDVGDNWKKIDGAKMPPMIAIPTTAGTGSEVGRASVITQASSHSKKIIFHPRMQPRLVIADAELTVSLPPHLTAATGMDAFAHCFEAYCAPGYHPMADGIALEGMRLIKEYLPIAYRDGSQIEARTHMLLSAAMGATAFQKGLGLVHAIAHPLGAMTNIHHGLSNAILLPYVMAYNRSVIEEPMRRLARHLDLKEENYSGVLEWMLSFRKALAIPHTLSDVDGIEGRMAMRLSTAALQDPSLATNPRSASAADIERVFLRAFNGELQTS